MEIQLSNLPKSLKNTLVVLLIALAFGYLSGLDLLEQTTDFKSKGIEENVLGNEIDEFADELHFKMSKRQLHAIIHSHVITLGLLFVLLSIMLFFTSYSQGMKSFLMIEPMISLIITFGVYGFMEWCALDEIHYNVFRNSYASFICTYYLFTTKRVII